MTTMMSGYQNLKVEARGPITVLTLHRPEVLNALNRETLLELERFVVAFLDDPVSRALIVTGAGEKSFVAGADINELAALDARSAEEASRFGQRVFDRLERSPKPVIAAGNGFPLGGGCELGPARHAPL